MATFRRGPFTRNICIPEVGRNADPEERSYAWRLYIEMTNRRAVCGDPKVGQEPSFLGEIFAHSFHSLKQFETELRNLVTGAGRNVPNIPNDGLPSAGAQILEVVISPFLEKWHDPYLLWWERQEKLSDDLVEKQTHFPSELLGPLEDEWRELRTFCREFCVELSAAYDLISIFGMVPDATREEWQEELAIIWKILGQYWRDEIPGLTDGKS